jgi:uncharacterized protein YkwD
MLAAVIFAAVVAAGAIALEPATPASALTNCTVSTESLDAQEAAFLALINDYRAQNGRTALMASPNLNRAAAWMATDMGAKQYFSHTDSLGRSPSTRAQNCGYPGGAGENIAAGTAWDTAQEAFTAWKNSPGHNSNMLNSSYRVIGIARVYTAGSPYGWYWVTDFGFVDDTGGSPTPTPSPTTTATTTSTPTATATPSPSSTATPAPASAAKLIRPVAGSKLATSWNLFQWNAIQGATSYRLDFGTSPGAANLGRINTTRTSLYISGVPAGYGTIYVRLWTQTSAGWAYTDSSFAGP